MADTLALAYGWILGRLNGSSTMTSLAAGRYYRKLAPEGSALPAITYNVLSWRDLNDINGHRCSARAIVVIQAITAGRALADLRPLMTELDVLFHNVQGDSSGGALWTSLRIEQLDTLDVVNGKEYSMLGGRFELWVTQITTPVDLSAHLAHHWPLTADLTDTVGSLDFTAVGTVPVSSDGATFDNDPANYLVTAATLALTVGQSFTLAGWAFFTDTDYGVLAALATGDGSVHQPFALYYQAAPVFYWSWSLWAAGFATFAEAEVDAVLSPSTWYLVVAYYDADAQVIGLSINGAAPVTAAVALAVDPTPGVLYVGGDPYSDTFAGLRANVRYYTDRVPDAPMLAALYAEGHAP